MSSINKWIDIKIFTNISMNYIYRYTWTDIADTRQKSGEDWIYQYRKDNQNTQYDIIITSWISNLMN